MLRALREAVSVRARASELRCERLFYARHGAVAPLPAPRCYNVTYVYAALR